MRTELVAIAFGHLQELHSWLQQLIIQSLLCMGNSAGMPNFRLQHHAYSLIA